MTTEYNKIKIRNLFFILGFVTFFINYFSSKYIGIPFGEFVIFGLIICELAFASSFVKNNNATIAIASSIIFVILCGVIEYYHEGSLGKMIHTLFRNSLFYLSVVLFAIAPNKNRIISLISGLILAYMFNFIFNAVIGVTSGLSGLWKLKYIIPSPAVIALFIMVLRNQLSKNLKLLMYSSFILIILLLPLSQGRGATLSTFIGLSFYIAYKYFRVPKTLIIAGALFIPITSVTVIFFASDGQDPQAIIDFLFSKELDSLSNLERTLAIHYSTQIMIENPIIGIGKADVPFTWKNDFEYYSSSLLTGESPHNYYLEIIAPHGLLPFSFMFITLYNIYSMFFTSVKNMNKNGGVAAFTCAAIGWIMLYQPVAGITRLDVMILCIVTLYGIRKTEHLDTIKHEIKNNDQQNK